MFKYLMIIFFSLTFILIAKETSSPNDEILNGKCEEFYNKCSRKCEKLPLTDSMECFEQCEQKYDRCIRDTLIQSN